VRYTAGQIDKMRQHLWSVLLFRNDGSMGRRSDFEADVERQLLTYLSQEITPEELIEQVPIVIPSRIANMKVEP
jgi:hypothetical protein